MGQKLTVTLNKLAIIIEIKEALVLILFLAVRKETSFGTEINFSIDKVIDKTNRNDTIYSEISVESSDFKNGIVQRTIQRTSKSDTVR